MKTNELVSKIAPKLASLAFLCFANAALAKTVYVAPLAQINGKGTESQPYTLETAFAVAKVEAIHEIILYDGTYEPLATLNLEIQRKDESPITIRAKNPGKAVVSGGYRLPHKKDMTRVLSWDISHNENLKDSRDLYIGKERAIRARSISYSSSHTNFSAIPNLVKENRDQPNSSVKIDSNFQIKDHTGILPPIHSWQEPSDIEFVFRCAWWEKRCGVKLIDRNKIEFAEPAWTIINTPWGNENASRLNAAMPKRTHIEGAIELMNSPGEWHSDGDTLRLIPPSNGNILENEIRLGKLQTILQVRKSSGIRLEGLVFAHTTWRLPIKTSGFNEGQANFEQYGTTGRPTESLGIYNSYNISFKNCEFRNMGGIGIGVFEQSSKVEIDTCRFLDIAGNAVVIGSTRDADAFSADQQVSEVKVTNCWVHNPASVYSGGVGIFVGFANNVIIRRNEICHAPYTGISVGWGWNEFDDVELDVHGHSIEENYVHHYLYEMYDGGGIYTLGAQSSEKMGLDHGLRITKNIIHNQGGLGNIIYTDGGSRWIRITENTTFNNLKELDKYYEGASRYNSDWGGCSPYGDILFENNTLGNAKNKFPNFRCSPKDPAPWSGEFKLPPRTIERNNAFLETADAPIKWKEKANNRHQGQSQTGLKSLLLRDIAQSEKNEGILEFSVAQTSVVSVKHEASLDTTLKLKSKHGTIAAWNSIERTFKLPEGKYFLDTKDPKRINFIIVSNLDSIFSKISTNSLHIDFEITGNIHNSLLIYDNGESENSILALKAKDGTSIAQNSNWIEAPYNWQILRSFIDSHQPLPTRKTPAIKTSVPSGTYTVKISNKTDSKATTIIPLQF